MKYFYTKIYHTKVSLHESFQIYGIFIVVQEECIVRFKELCTIVKNKKEAQTEH